MQFIAMFLTSAVVLAMLGAEHAAKADDLASDRIAREWARREGFIKTARITWSFQETHAKAFSSTFRYRPPLEKDLIMKSIRKLTIGDNNTRLEQEGEAWSPEKRRLEPFSLVITFDGNIYSRTILPHGQAGHPDAVVKKAQKCPEWSAVNMLPIWYSFRSSLADSYNFSINNYRPTGKTIEINKHIVYEFIREFPEIGMKRQIFIDAERDFQVVRYLELDNEKVTVKLDVQLRHDPYVGWIPDSWDHVWCTSEGLVILSSHSSLIEFIANPDVSPSSFVFQPPAGTRVADLTSGEEQQYGILPDGTKGKAIRAAGRGDIRYDELMSQHQTGRRSPIRYIVIVITLCSIATFLLILLRLRRRRSIMLRGSDAG